MSKENVAKFYGEVSRNEKIRKEFEFLKNKVKKGTKEESLAKEIVSIGKKNGFNFTEEELKSYTKELKGILNEDELLSVSGGIDIKKVGLMGTMILACAAGTAAISSSAAQPNGSITSSYSARYEEGQKVQSVNITNVEVTNRYSLSLKYDLRVTVDTKKSFSITTDLLEKIAGKVEHGWINKSVGIDPSLIEKIEFIRADGSAAILNKTSKSMQEKGIETKGNVAILGEGTYKKIKDEENAAKKAREEAQREAQAKEKEEREAAEIEARAKKEEAEKAAVQRKAQEKREKEERAAAKAEKDKVKLNRKLVAVEELIREANNEVESAKLKIPKLNEQIKSAQGALNKAREAMKVVSKKIDDGAKNVIENKKVKEAIKDFNELVEKAMNEAKKAAEIAKAEAQYKLGIAEEKARIGEAKKAAEKVAAERETQTEKEEISAAESEAAAKRKAQKEAKEAKKKERVEARKANIEAQKKERQRLKQEEKEKRARKQEKKTVERKKKEDQSKEDKNAMMLRKGEKLAQKSRKIDTSFLDEDYPSFLSEKDKKRMEKDFDREFYETDEESSVNTGTVVIHPASEHEKSLKFPEKNPGLDTLYGIRKQGESEGLRESQIGRNMAAEMGLPNALDMFKKDSSESNRDPNDEKPEVDTGTVVFHPVSDQEEESGEDTGTVVFHSDSGQKEESEVDTGTVLIKKEQEAKNVEQEEEKSHFKIRQVQVPMPELNKDGKLYKTLEEMNLTEDEFKESVEVFAGLLDELEKRALGDGAKQRPGLILKELKGQIGIGPLMLGAPRIVSMLNTPNSSVIEILKEYIQENQNDNIFSTLFGDKIVNILEDSSKTVEDVRKQAKKLKQMSTFVDVFYRYLDLEDLKEKLDLPGLLPKPEATEESLRSSMRSSLRASMKERASSKKLNNEKIKELRKVILEEKEQKEERSVAEVSQRKAQEKKQLKRDAAEYILDRESFNSSDIIGWAKDTTGSTLILCVKDESKIGELRTSDDIINACIRFGINPENYSMFKVKQGFLKNKETKECLTVGIKANRIAVGTKNLRATKEKIERQLPFIVNSCAYSARDEKNHYHVYDGEEKDRISTAIRTNSVAMRVLVKGIYQRLRIDENEKIYLKYDGEDGEWKEFGSNGQEVTEEAKIAAEAAAAEKEANVAETFKQVDQSAKTYMTGKTYVFDSSNVQTMFNGGKKVESIIYLYDSGITPVKVYSFDDIFNACLKYNLDPTNCTSVVVQQTRYGGFNTTKKIDPGERETLNALKAIKEQLPKLVNASVYHSDGGTYKNYEVRAKVPSTLENKEVFMRLLLKGIRERFGLGDETDGVQLYYNNAWHAFAFSAYGI